MNLVEEIVEYLNHYQKNNKIIDQEFIEIIFGKIIKRWQVSNKPLNVKITNKNQFPKYDYTNNKLYVTITQEIEDSKIFSEEDRLMVYNLKIFQRILKEIIKATTWNYAFEDGNDVQWLHNFALVTYDHKTCKFVDDKPEEFDCFNNICINPINRGSEIKSRILITELVEKLNFYQLDNAKDYYELLYYLSCIGGYDNYYAPSVLWYFQKTSSPDLNIGLLNKIFQHRSESYDLWSKVYLGYPITNEEKNLLFEKIFSCQTTKTLLEDSKHVLRKENS